MLTGAIGLKVGTSGGSERGIYSLYPPVDPRMVGTHYSDLYGFAFDRKLAFILRLVYFSYLLIIMCCSTYNM